MAKPLRMHQLKRIIELYQQGQSIRQAQRLTGLSRTTIRDYHHRIQSSGLNADKLLALDEESLLSLISIESFDQGPCGRKADDRHVNLVKDLDRYCGDLILINAIYMLISNGFTSIEMIIVMAILSEKWV